MSTSTTAPDAAPETLLGPLHRELQARMVPFAGYSMPVQYADGIIAEHNHCRASAGLFDVSHMGQIEVRGEQAGAALESLIPVDIINLASGRQRYGFFTNDSGGILDDLMVARIDKSCFVLIVNAACKERDYTYLVSEIGNRCDITELDDRGLMALQGPLAADVLIALGAGVESMRFLDVETVTIDGVDCVVSRSGYTGEDGFELSVPDESMDQIARLLLADSRVAPIGLGARDSLRLEAGLCLYGHDIDEKTTPVEAALTFALNRSRRAGGERPGGYKGASVIEKQLADGARVRRVGLAPDGRAPIREGVELLLDGEPVGRVTSGGYGSTIAGPVAMGYVNSELAIAGQSLTAVVRGKDRPCVVRPLPFVAHNYRR